VDNENKDKIDNELENEDDVDDLITNRENEDESFYKFHIEEIT
jgi:hypothetical protein